MNFEELRGKRTRKESHFYFTEEKGSDILSVTARYGISADN